MDDICLRIFDADGMDDLPLLRLLEWLPKSVMRGSADAYLVYEWLPSDRHMIGKRGAVNQNKALRPKSARQLELAANADKALRQERGYADTPIADSV